MPEQRMVPGLAMPAEQRRDSSTWLGIIEAMEAELEHGSVATLSGRQRGESDAGGGTRTPVTLPTAPGPIPGELVERARHLLAAQHRAIERVETAQRETGRHLAAMRSVPPHRDSRSVYLDTSA